MLRGLTITALLMALGWPTGAQAAPGGTSPAQLVQLNKTFTQLLRLNSQRAQLLARLRRFHASVRTTRARPAGPARDFKLRRLLAGARTLAKRLSAKDKQVTKALADVTAARMSLIRTLARLKKPQQTRARRALVNTAGKSQRRQTVLRIAKTRLDPLDGPREINEKADLLSDSEEKIRKRLQEISQVISRLGKRQKLRRIARGVDRYSGLFAEDTSRRRVTRIRPAKTTSVGDPGVPAEGLQNTNDMDAGYTPSATFGDDSHSRGTSSSTYAVVLKELLTPTTLAALRKAGRSSDPRVRLRALRKARAELQRAIAKLKARAKRYRAKAKRLRQNEQNRRR